MQRIAFIFSEFNTGGMETSMIRIARSMIDSKKYKVFFITTENESFFVPNDITYFHIDGFNKFFPYFHFLKVYKFFSKEKFDIHLVTYERVFQSICGLIGGTKISLLRNDHPEVYKRAFANFKYIDGFIGNSPNNNFYIESYPSRKKKFFQFIPNGIEINKEYVFCRKKTSDFLKILYVGRIVDDSKGVFGLIDICNQLNNDSIDFELLIIGDGPDLGELKDRFKCKSYFKKIGFLPFLEKSKLFNEYQNSDILLLPSNYEGLPNVLLEAQLHGCIPIATHLIGSTDLVIQNNINGFLVNKYNYKEFASKINFLDKNRDFLHSISIACHQNIINNFSAEREFEDFHNSITAVKDIEFAPHRNFFEIPISFDLFNPINILKTICRAFIKKLIPRYQ